jgi:hypothetical protein
LQPPSTCSARDWTLFLLKLASTQPVGDPNAQLVQSTLGLLWCDVSLQILAGSQLSSAWSFWSADVTIAVREGKRSHKPALLPWAILPWSMVDI